MATQFDGQTRLITLTTGTTSLSVQDLWSDWVRWHASADNSKYLPAFSIIGGDPIDATAGTYIPYYCYLMNGWRIRPQEADHTLNVTGGILLVDGGAADAFVPTLGNFTVQINRQQPVQAITIATAGGASQGPTALDIAAAVKLALATDFAALETTSQADTRQGIYMAEFDHLSTLIDLMPAAVRTELAVELARLDAAVSTRLASGDYSSTPPLQQIAQATWEYLLNSTTTAKDAMLGVGTTLANGVGLTPVEHDYLRRMYEIHGLDPAVPLVVSVDTRLAGDMVQSITDVNGIVTVTRTA
jgi:hypothetical protein